MEHNKILMVEDDVPTCVGPVSNITTTLRKLTSIFRVPVEICFTARKQQLFNFHLWHTITCLILTLWKIRPFFSLIPGTKKRMRNVYRSVSLIDIRLFSRLECNRLSWCCFFFLWEYRRSSLDGSCAGRQPSSCRRCTASRSSPRTRRRRCRRRFWRRDVFSTLGIGFRPESESSGLGRSGPSSNREKIGPSTDFTEASNSGNETKICHFRAIMLRRGFGLFLALVLKLEA